MQNRMYRKRRAKKKRPGSKLLYYLQPRSALVVIAMFAVCLLLVAFAVSHKQVAPDASTLTPTVPTVVNTAVPIAANGGNTQNVKQTTGIFSLSSGGPIPVPANVLHPSNIARVVQHNELMSIYAGAMTRTPTIGAIAILQENIITGQQSLNIYQTTQPVGSLTVLAIHNDMLTISTLAGHGTFNLLTHQFHFA
ncbi:MAG: hypothetical protein ACYDER_28090 [Ktedonobacteraceae bacterium]